MNYFYLSLLLLALVLIECLIGGLRMAFALPSYGILSLAAVSTLLSFRKPQFPANIICLGTSLLFFAYLLGRILKSPVEYLARPDLYSVLAVLVVYSMIAFFLTAPKHRLWLLLGLLVIALAQVSVGVLQYLRREHFQIFSFIQPPDYGARASGFYNCPDHFAGYLEVVALMGLSAACWSRWKHWLKICAGYLSLMCLLGIILSGSRGGQLSTAFGFLVFIALSLWTLRKGSMDRKLPVAIGLIVAACLIVVAGFYFISGQFTLSSRWKDVLEKGTDRIGIWKTAVAQFQLDPVYGTGAGTHLYYQRHFRTTNQQADSVYVHNDYLHLLAEYGIIGAVAFILFLVAHVGNGLRSFKFFVNERMSALGRIRSDTLALNIGALSGLATYLVHSAVDFNLHIPSNALLMAVVAAILANPGVDLPFATARFHKTNRYVRLVVPALGLWLAFAGLPNLRGEWFTEQAAKAYANEQYSACVALAEKGIATERRNPNLYWFLGQGHYALGEAAPNAEVAEVFFKSALQAYTKALPLSPKDRYLLLGMGWSLDALKRFDEAEPYFKEILEFEPNSMQIRAYYAAHFLAAGKLDQAEQEYNRSMQLGWNWAAKAGLERLAKERNTSPAPKP